jgi:type IV secretory pathway VirD2 relaxase
MAPSHQKLAEIRGFDGANRWTRARLMPEDDEFFPKLGRIRDRGEKKGRKFLNQVIAAANLARGGAAAFGMGKRGFTGSRIGRGAGVGRVLAARDRFAAFRQRRVIIKSRIVRLTGKAVTGARAHLRYVQRDGVTRNGAPGELYGPAADRVDGRAFLERGGEDRHQFRFIVSAEDGGSYEDLKPLTRRLMAQMEEDLGTRLDWVAVDHFNTGHPHSHIILRGADERGRDLVIARDYLSSGMRERAAELVQLDLGPRADREIEERLRAEVDQERLTSIDRALLGRIDADGLVRPADRDPIRQTLEAGRLQRLVRMGLAEELHLGQWRLAQDLEQTLRALGDRGDILKTLHRELGAHALARSADDRAIFDPRAETVRPLVGRVITRGLADELADRHYLIVDGVDGRTHYVDVGKGEAVEPLPEHAIVRVVARPIAIRDVDRTVTAVAAANGGRYDIDAHLRHDPHASEAFAETHVRRLEAMRRATGGVERRPDGSWTIASDHLDRVAAFEARQARDRPVDIELLSPLPLERLGTHDGATWLDRELTADATPLRDAGFGCEVRQAQAMRRQWLLSQGLADERAGVVGYPNDLLHTLQRRELLRAAGQLSEGLGLPFVEARKGERIEGVMRSRIDLASGRYALIEKSKEFTLVPWRPELEKSLGQPLSGTVMDGGINWAIGRSRSSRSIS